MHYAITILLLLACSCVRQASPPETDTLPKFVRSIAVMPVGVINESGGAPSPQSAKALEEGLAALDQILVETWSSNRKIRMLSEEEVSSHSLSYNASLAAQTVEIGRAVGAEAVMIWGLERYKERSGGDYGVQAPASVAFQYRLIHTESGRTLCSVSFEETQQSATDNLLAFNALAKRGFKWVPASVLLREGVSKKLAECDYLQSQGNLEEDPPSGNYKASSGVPAVESSSKSTPEADLSTSNKPQSSAAIPEQQKMSSSNVSTPASGPHFEAIAHFLDEWRKAWEATAGPNGDVERYGAFYAADFRNNSQGRGQWLNDKAKKNHGKAWIRVKISDVTIAKTADSSLLETNFTQEYSSSNFSDTRRKSLFIRQNGSNWEIVAER